MGQLELKDLTFALSTDPQAKNLGSLKHQLEKFQYDQDSGSSKPLNAPLAKNLQQKIDRHAAYKETTKDISKWKPFIAKNRKADHVPLHPQFENSARMFPSTSKMTKNFKPQGSFEEQVSALLTAAGFQSEQSISKMEAEEMSKAFSPQEIAVRQAHLAKVRSMAFLHEVRQKHAAKIKSKAYHRIKKKEKLKEAGAILSEQPEQLIPQQEKILAELERAHKRLTLKGKKNSKWLKELAASIAVQQEQSTEESAFQAEQEAEALKMKLFQLEAEDENVEAVLAEQESEPKTIFERLLSKKSTFSLEDKGDEEYFEGDSSTEATEAKPAKDAKKEDLSGKNGRFSMHFDSASQQKQQSPTEIPSSNPSANALMPNANAFVEQISIEESQRELVKRAFSADKVIEESFLQEKAQEIEQDIDEQIEKPVFLPGWGSWAGNGAVESKGAQRTKQKLHQEYEAKKRAALSKRKDFHLSHVIINEQQIGKRQKQFALDKVPHPYKSLEEYQRALNTPIGREWTTFGGFQEAIKPKYEFKGGIVIGAPKLQVESK